MIILIGQGLGVQNQGRTEALKPDLKFDRTGLGHDPGKEFKNHWWEKLYDEAAKKIDVISAEVRLDVVKIDPLGQPTVTAGSDHYFQSVRPHFSKTRKNKTTFKWE